MRISSLICCLFLISLFSCRNQLEINNTQPVYEQDEFAGLNLNYPQELTQLEKAIRKYQDDPFLLSLHQLKKALVICEQGDIQQTKTLLQSIQNRNLPELQEFLNICWSSYQLKKGRADSALYYMLEVEKNWEKRENDIDSLDLHHLVLNQLGAVYFQLGAFETSREYFTEALEIIENKYGNEVGVRAILLINLAFIYGRLGNHVREKEALDEAQRIMNMLPHVSPMPKALFYHQLVRHYMNEIEYEASLQPDLIPMQIPAARLAQEKAMKAQEEAILWIEKLPPNVNTALIYANYPELYAGLRKLAKAEEWLQKAEDLLLQFVDKENYFYAAFLMKKAIITLAAFRPEESRKYFGESYAIFDGIFPGYHPIKGMIKTYEGNSYLLPALFGKKEEGVQKGFLSYDSAIYELSENQSMDQEGHFPIFEGALDLPMLREIMQSKGNVYFENSWLSASQQEAMQKALPFYLAAERVNEQILASFPFLEAQEISLHYTLMHNTRIIMIYDSLYRMTGRKIYLEKAFYHTEKTKANRLLLKLRNEQLGETGSVFSYIKTRLDRHAKEIARLESMIPFAVSEPMANSLKSQVFAEKQAYENLLQDFKKDYGTLYAQMYAVKPLFLSEIQAQLSPDQALMEFYVYEGIRIFTITADTAFLMSLPYKDYRYLPRNMWEGIMGGKNIDQKKAYSTYTQAAYELYSTFFEAPLAALGKETKSLYIITGGGLSKLPMEILLMEEAPTQEVDYSLDNLAYLFESYDISYGYSASTLFMSQQMKSKSNKMLPYLAFAPSFDGYNQDKGNQSMGTKCGDLRWNQLDGLDSLMLVAERWNGSLKTGKDASVAQFRQHISHGKILHLYTHACLDEADQLNSMLIFSDKALLARDIYPMKTDADLVFLTACETASGTESTAEGIMGIANGFASAGCSSVVGGYWKIPEKASLEISMRFFHHLKEGFARHQALRMAKLDYLEKQMMNTGDASSMAPYNWAGLVHIGNVGPGGN